MSVSRRALQVHCCCPASDITSEPNSTDFTLKSSSFLNHTCTQHALPSDCCLLFHCPPPLLLFSLSPSLSPLRLFSLNATLLVFARESHSIQVLTLLYPSPSRPVLELTHCAELGGRRFQCFLSNGISAAEQRGSVVPHSGLVRPHSGLVRSLQQRGENWTDSKRRTDADADDR